MDVEYIARCGEAIHPGAVDGRGYEVVPEPGGSGARDRAHKRLSSSANAPSKGRVLIVDDDPAVRETLADLLEIVGYCPLQAADAVEAMAILRQKVAICALVSDLTMPRGDGITLIRHARELRHGLPAILLTGYADQAASVAMVAGGNFHVLRKPVESEHLIAQLDLLIASSPDA
jgi:DNA-binding NtrC family response regulator